MSDTEQKPKRVWTEEQLAKRRATAAATKARKDAEKAAAAGAVDAPAPEAPKKEKKARKPKEPKEAKGGAGAEEDAPAPETPKKEKKEKKVPDAPKKEKTVVEETAPENKTTWQPIIALVFNMKNDNYEEDGSAGEKWFEDRTYFANDGALRRYLTDRINNWSDEFSTMIRGIADDSPTQIANYIDMIIDSPFLTNHPLSEDFAVSRFSAAIHQ